MNAKKQSQLSQKLIDKMMPRIEELCKICLLGKNNKTTLTVFKVCLDADIKSVLRWVR